MKHKNLNEAVNQLCGDLKTASDNAHPRLAKYNTFTAEAGRKFIKIINIDTF